MADETKALAPLPAKTQEALNIEMYGRVYETFLKKAEELGKARGWATEDILSSADTMYQQYFDDQVQLAKDGKMHRMLGTIMEQIPALRGLF